MNALINHIKKNWQSGITVALVSIPLSISLAVASQTTPLSGIITGIWAGFVASLFGGSNFNIIGPTGALSGILASYALLYGPAALSSLAVVTGFFILIAYLFQFERYLVFVPGSTVHGFTLGVACIIAFNQLNFALGLPKLPVHEHFLSNVWESFTHISFASLPTCICFLLFLGTLFICAYLLPKFPGVILITPISIGLGYLSALGHIPFTLETLAERYGSISFSLFSMSQFHYNPTLISTGIMLAFIAILETMISARIADGMTKTRHNPRKELLGLGFANIASGIVGGIPATAALARTALNVRAHATHKFSATICSIAIALISVLFLSYFSYIPLAVIAAILVYTAIRMIELDHFFKLFHYDKTNFFISLLVAFITIYQDPIIAILFGIALSLVVFMKQLSHGYFKIHYLHKKIEPSDTGSICKSEDTIVYTFQGHLSYINSQAHFARFETETKKYTQIILNFADTNFVDTDGIDILSEIIDLLHSQNKKVLVAGIDPALMPLFMISKQFKILSQHNLVFNSVSDACIITTNS